MKGIQGIVIAVALGITGAVCNWLYLSNQARNYQSVSFVAVRADAGVNFGDRFKEDYFVRVDVPKSRVGNLERTAVKWEDRMAWLGIAATRSYGESGDEILLHQELKTPAKKDLNTMIGESERIMWLPVDSRTFNPSHVNPGDSISFRVPQYASSRPIPAKGSSGARPGSTTVSAEIIGPFRILALGNRKGRRDVRKAAGLSSGAENTLAISVIVDKNGHLEARAQQLSQILQLTNFQGVQALLHPASEQEE